MTCDERQDLILLYALDALDPSDREAIDAHLEQGCARCAGAFSEAQGVVASLALSADAIAAPPGARDRLMSRVRAALADAPTPAPDPAPTPAIPIHRDADADGVAPPRRFWRRLGPALAAAACVGMLIGGLATWLATRDRARLAGAPEVQMVLLDGGEFQPLARGRIFRDTVRHRWHLFVFDLKRPASGKTYELWLIAGDQKKIPAGTFDVDADGNGTVVVPITDDLPPLIAVAITDEPLGGSDQPTGMIHLSGAIR